MDHHLDGRTDMSSFQSRQVIPAFVACAVAAGILLVAGSALADLALFRVEQRWHNVPNPPVTSPGGAGMDQGYIQPDTTRTAKGEYLYPPPTAVVEPGNPIGGALTLPTGFINVTRTYTITPQTGWPGYTTVVYEDYYNGPGKFQPNFGSTASNLRLVFPTTGGNPTPNWGSGSPLTPTTTFSGRYDISRGGSINVTPGPRRFGGTFRLFFAPEAGWKKYISYFSPALYQGYGYYFCFDDGMYDCTPNTFESEPGTTAISLDVWWRLTEKGRAKATTPTTPNGTVPTPYGNASYLKRSHHYLNLIHPWTTGFARARNFTGYWNVIPQAQGYDTSLGGVDITVPHYDRNWHWNKTLSTLTTTTQTYKQYLKGVTRVVSMVRPRLVWTFAVPAPGGVLNPKTISNIWSTAWIWNLKVFFLPEPGGMLMLGTGIAALLGLSRMRRR
jgi:hypothetical protein